MSRNITTLWLNCSQLSTVCNLWRGVRREYCLLIKSLKPKQLGTTSIKHAKQPEWFFKMCKKEKRAVSTLCFWSRQWLEFVFCPQAFTSASQGFLNCLVYGWTCAHLRRAGRRVLSRDMDTQTPLLRSQKKRSYQTLRTVGWKKEKWQTESETEQVFSVICSKDVWTLTERENTSTESQQRMKTSTSDPEPLRWEKGKKKKEGEFTMRGRATKKTGFERDRLHLLCTTNLTGGWKSFLQFTRTRE